MPSDTVLKPGDLQLHSPTFFADFAQVPSDFSSETRHSTLAWHWKYQLWPYVWTSPQPNNPLLGKALNSIWSRGSVLIPDYGFFILTEQHGHGKYMCSSAIKNLLILSVPWLINLVVTSFLCGKANNRGWNVCRKMVYQAIICGTATLIIWSFANYTHYANECTHYFKHSAAVLIN